MTHWRSLLDPGIYLGPQDFPTERPVKIARIVREKKPAREGEKESSAPMLYVQAKDGSEYPRPLPLPKSVMYGLSLALGVDVEGWVGKEIALYRTKCLSFGDVEECVRPRFTPDVVAKIRGWLKKRKASPKVFEIADGGAS